MLVQQPHYEHDLCCTLAKTIINNKVEFTANGWRFLPAVKLKFICPPTSLRTRTEESKSGL